MRSNCYNNLRRNITFSGETNGENRYVQSGIGSMRTLRLISPHRKFPPFFSPPFFINIPPINIMPSKPTTARRRLTSEKHAAILALRKGGKSFDEIARQMKLVWSTITTIVHRAIKQQNASPASKKPMGRPLKLNARDKRALIRYVEKNPHDNLTALASPSKSGQQLSRSTVRRYLKGCGFLRFKARRKPYLTIRHKAARLVWGRKHKHWTVKDWVCVVWTDEATYETGLDTRSSYVTRRKGMAMEPRYLKLTFKSGRSTIGAWGGIILKKKNPLHILIKKRRMNSDIYINEVLNPIKLSFSKRCLATNPKMIWMDDDAAYHISKKMLDWGRINDFNRMDWPAQSPDLNPIENLWRIIKLRISARRHQIHTIEAMKQTIKEEWDLLTEKDYKKYIESMPRRIQLLIKAKGGQLNTDHLIFLIIQIFTYFESFKSSNWYLHLGGDLKGRGWGVKGGARARCTQTSGTRLYRQGSVSVGCFRRRNNWDDRFSNLLASSFFCFFFDISHVTFETKNYLLKWFHSTLVFVVLPFRHLQSWHFERTKVFFLNDFSVRASFSLRLRSLDGRLRKKALSGWSVGIALAPTKY